jgi:hypothetical protein
MKMTDAPPNEVPSLASSPPGDIPAAPTPVAGANPLYPQGGDAKPADLNPGPADAPKSLVEGEKPVEPVAAPPAPVEPAAPLTLESYEVKLPESLVVAPELLSDFKKAALEAKLPPEAAQGFANLYAKALEGQMSLLTQKFQENQQTWLKEVEQIPEFQGERRTQSLAVLGRAMEEYGSPEAAKIFNESGIGNHPAVVKFIYSLAHGLVEGTPLPANRPAINGGKPARTAGQIMYPSMEKPN